jgi:hypothetical protein
VASLMQNLTFELKFKKVVAVLDTSVFHLESLRRIVT